MVGKVFCAVELFLNRDNIRQIQFVVRPDAAEEAKRKYGANLAFSGVKLVSAGPKWIDQLIAGDKAGRCRGDSRHRS